MELGLNLVWLFAVVALLSCWCMQRRSASGSCIRELLAIAALVLILFPVVSVTDDLLVATNVAETDSSVRRSPDDLQPHSIFPSGAAHPEQTILFAPALSAIARIQPPMAVFHPVQRSFPDLANRPPPAV